MTSGSASSGSRNRRRRRPMPPLAAGRTISLGRSQPVCLRAGAAMSQVFMGWFICMLLFGGSFVVYLRAAETPGARTPGDPSAKSVVVPFEMRRGHIMVPTRVNGSNSLSLLLDTGYSMTMLSSEHIEAFGLKRTGRVTIVGIAGEEPANVFEGPTFEFFGSTWKPRRVAAFPAEAPSGARRRDGILGAGFFRRFVVEIDPLRKTLLLWEPDTYQYSGDGEILPLTFKASTPIVDATVYFATQGQVKAQFEIDTGCDGCLCLGRHFVEAHHLVPTNAPSRQGRSGVGGGTRTRSGHLAALHLGNLVIEHPPANFFLDGSPVDAPLAGHIGLELLRDFMVTFDYARRRMILERLTNNQRRSPQR